MMSMDKTTVTEPINKGVTIACEGIGRRIVGCSVFFILSLMILIADQLSKFYAVKQLVPYQSIPIWPMLNITLAYNTGAAFSFLNGAGPWHLWFFMVLSVVVSLALMILICRLPRSEPLQRCSLSLILGGAVGNLLDRVHYQYVIDFIDVYYKNYHWPIFNIADSAITIGSILLVIDLCLRSSKKQVEK